MWASTVNDCCRWEDAEHWRNHVVRPCFQWKVADVVVFLMSFILLSSSRCFWLQNITLPSLKFPQQRYDAFVLLIFISAMFLCQMWAAATSAASPEASSLPLTPWAEALGSFRIIASFQLILWLDSAALNVQTEMKLVKLLIFIFSSDILPQFDFNVRTATVVTSYSN